MLNSLHMQAPATTSIARRELLLTVGTTVLALSTAQWPAVAAGSTVFVAGSTGNWHSLSVMYEMQHVTAGQSILLHCMLKCEGSIQEWHCGCQACRALSLQCLAAVLCAGCGACHLQGCPCSAAQHCPICSFVSLGLLCWPAVLSIGIIPVNALFVYILELPACRVNWQTSHSGAQLKRYQRTSRYQGGFQTLS